MLTRRDLYRYGSIVLGGAMSLGLAIPGVAYVLDPLRPKGSLRWRQLDSGEYFAEAAVRLPREGVTPTSQELTRLSALKVGVPQSFPIIAERRDAWVKYPPEPVGSVWLVRQPAGASPLVIAFTAECPHLGCAIAMAGDGKTFLCPCHKSIFDLAGKRLNDLSPRHMDTLDVALTSDDDPGVVVYYLRYRTQTKEKIPLV